jgi:hypothetical protein
MRFEPRSMESTKADANVALPLEQVGKPRLTSIGD